MSQSRQRPYGIGVCPDCGGSVERVPVDDPDLDDVVCIADGCDWSYVDGICHEAGYATDGGPEFEMPEGHGQPAQPALPPRVFLLPAVAFTGGVMGATLGALTSPVTAILLVAAVIVLPAGSIVLFREVSG